MLGTSSRNIFDPPTLRERILTSPLQFIITNLYHSFNALYSTPKPSSKSCVRVICISDTHTKLCSIPSGDLLIHAGDLANKGTVSEIQAQIDWLASLPHAHKIVIAGNHDTYLDPRSRTTLSPEEQAETLDWKDITYLQHSGTKLKFENGRVLCIYGAPQIPKCGGSNFAFQYDRILDAWTDTVPRKTDVLVTHTPPKYHLDLQYPWLGCVFLLREVWKIRPVLHVFGHVHAGAGRELVRWDDMQEVYEGSMAREGRKGFIRQLISLHLWMDALRVIFYGVTGVIWDRVWGGDAKGTLMVNAALSVNNTGKLGNAIQIVDI
ncbi:Metallo-dependent phosphatase [Microthyrium microscopicum]|uniref:Metallo-dependent phosphatase n=1 Tax=Microthyrium microscopicum TaxID=703497 RepID=A0A6A6U1T7_9PEZI|nr:Metallo-dependent phosphatase [Microthyrium microscopicum]